jgi:hypothetical protein
MLFAISNYVSSLPRFLPTYCFGMSKTVSAIRRRGPAHHRRQLDRQNRTQPIRGAFDPVIGRAQAALAIERGGKTFPFDGSTARS